MSVDILLLSKIILALLLGIFIGTEREYHKGKVGLGIRTTAFISLIGMLSTYFSLIYNSSLIMLFTLFTVAGFSISIFWYRVKEQLHHVGLTSSATILVTFFIGAMVAVNLFIESIILSVAVFILLFSKKNIKHKIKNLTEEEIVSAIQFAIVAFVIYPFIPDEKFIFVNFKEVWLIVILVSLMSFLGFLAIRRFGDVKGVLFTSIFGGILTSGATTVALINNYKKDRKLLNLFLVGILLTSLIMVFRNLIVGFIVSHDIGMLVPFLRYIIISIVYAIFVFYFLIKRFPHISKRKHKINVKSPFAIKPALYFGAIFVFILFISKLAFLYFGDQGVIIVSFFGGLVNSAATTASSATLFMQGYIDMTIFVYSILLATIASWIDGVFVAYLFNEKKLATALFKYMFILVILLLGVSLI